MYRLYLCTGPHCTARGSRPLQQAIEQALWQHNLLGSAELLCTGCQDHCNYGPNLIVRPDEIRYYGLDAERVQRIVAEHLVGKTPITEWRATPEMRRKP
jgi:(2Fe-2S) ferredoxin